MSTGGIFKTDDWTFSEGTLNGEHDIELFPNLLIVEWHYFANSDDWLPSSQTLDDMTEFEERVLDACDSEIWWGTGVAVLTFPGVREWRFYCGDPQQFLVEFSRILDGLGPYPLKIQSFEDPEWNALKELQN
jgi:Family of unknown function (DUF695)